MAESTNSFDQWGIVEVMGHKKYAGHITEQVIGGSALIRVDVPAVTLGERAIPEYSKLIGTGSIYMITPTSEEVTRRAALRLAQTPRAIRCRSISPRRASSRQPLLRPTSSTMTTTTILAGRVASDGS